MRGKVLRCAPNTNSPRCARSVRPAATTKKRGAQILLFIIRLESAPSGGLPRARQSSPLRSEHEQPALCAVGSTCCYNQKKRSTNLIIYNQIGKCPFRGLAACAAKFSAALRTRTAPRSARRCWSTDCAPAKAP